MTKLNNVIISQESWGSTLEDKLSVLEEGITKAGQNNEIIQKLQARQVTLNMMTPPNCNELPFNIGESKQVLYAIL